MRRFGRFGRLRSTTRASRARPKPTADHTMENWNAVIATNLTGVLPA